MSIEDTKIGRAALGVEAAVAVGTVSGNFLAASANGFSLLIGAPAAGTISISTVSPAVLGQGFTIAAGSLPLRLTLEADGDFVTKALFAIASAATTVGVYRTVMPLT